MMKKVFCSKTSFALALAALITVGSASAEPWKFGVMGDTQWTTPSYDDPAGTNPNTVSASILNQVNQQFIKAGVKFVIQVGDLSDGGQDIDEITRAKAAQPLIDAGIGFFPMRGNHETYGTNNNYSIPILQKSYPQTQGGIFLKSNGKQYNLGNNFSSPTSVSMDLAGMSYSFDYNDHGDSARFVILDNWVTPSKNIAAAGYNYGYSFGDQQTWISSRLDKNGRGTQHAFVFSHQPLIAEDHQDSPFVGYTNANPAMQNAFFASLQSNDVKYYISGHDHMHQRSIVASPDGLSNVQEIISASNSSKFYTPKALTDPNWFGQKTRETSVSQERYLVGYYIYTVDGPCVTVDYYSDVQGPMSSDNCYAYAPSPESCGTTAGSHITPTFTFVKKETWGYCQNGKEFLVPQTTAYTTVQDSFQGTTAQILNGTNNSTATDYDGRAFTKTVDTGWVDVDGWCKKYPLHQSNDALNLASDIFLLRGMADLGSSQTDTYALSLNYDQRKAEQRRDGLLVLAARNEKGYWVNAVDMNVGGTKNFVLGPYKSTYGLGTYGIDPATNTVWAVINRAGNFAVASF